MQRYTKTNWVVDVTKINPTNMNKIENQLETLTDEVINIETDMPTVPTNVSAFTNDAGYLTQHQDITGKENNTNKVTSISSSSTDTQYPSAKCVYDAINNAIGNVLGGSY